MRSHEEQAVSVPDVGGGQGGEASEAETEDFVVLSPGKGKNKCKGKGKSNRRSRRQGKSSSSAEGHEEEAEEGEGDILEDICTHAYNAAWWAEGISLRCSQMEIRLMKEQLEPHEAMRLVMSHFSGFFGQWGARRATS